MIVLVLSLLSLTSVLAQNWCTVPYCNPNSHVSCNAPSTFPPGCQSPTLHVLNQDNINTILTRQNTLRNSAASGTLRGFNNVILPSANRMARTQWSNQLANFAVDNVRRCVFSHDSCRSSSQFNFAGQNLAMRWQTNPTINVNAFLTDMINMWFNQHVNVRVSDINNFQGGTGGNGQTIGHFTAMSNEMQTHMGCAVGSWNSVSNPGFREFLLTCNYAFTNFLGRRVWATGAPTSACITGRDPQFTNLCTINEPINVNDWRRSYPSDAFFYPYETEAVIDIQN